MKVDVPKTIRKDTRKNDWFIKKCEVVKRRRDVGYKATRN